MIEYEIANNKGYGYIFIIIDSFYEYTWCIPLKNTYKETITKDFSNVLTNSKRKPFKTESD